MMLEQIAIVFVFIANAVSIILLGFMLFRISKQTEATHKMLHGGGQDLLDAGKRLRDALKSTDRLVDRLGELYSKPPEQQQAAPVPPEQQDQHFKVIEDMLKDLSGRKFEDHSRFLEDIKQLLDSVAGSTPEGLSQWRDANQNRLETAQLQRNRMAAEMEALKVRLEDSNKIISELRRSVRLAEASGQAADALRTNLDQTQQLLGRAKERASNAEARVEALTRELDLMRLDAEKASPGKDNAAVQSLKRQVDDLIREKDGLLAQLEKMRDTMQRTLIEKDFIEEKLLDLDAAAHPPRAS